MCFNKNDKLFQEQDWSSAHLQKRIIFWQSFAIVHHCCCWSAFGGRTGGTGFGRAAVPRRRRTVFSLWQVCHNISKAEAEANFINELGSQQKEVDTLPSNTGMYILCMYVYLVCICTHTSVEDSAMKTASCLRRSGGGCVGGGGGR